MKEVYILWAGTNHVDLDGSIEEDSQLGYFDSLDSLNEGIVKYWYNMPFDTRRYQFNEIEESKKIKKTYNGFEEWIYYTTKKLNVI